MNPCDLWPICHPVWYLPVGNQCGKTGSSQPNQVTGRYTMAPYYYITYRYCSLRLKCCSGATLRGQIENASLFGTWQAELFDFAQIWPEANRPEKKRHVRGQDSNNLNLTSRDLGFIKNKSMFPFLGLIAAVLWFWSLLVICDFNLFHFVIWHQKWWNKWPKMTLKHFKRQPSHGLPVDKRASHVTFRRGHVTRAISDRKRRYKSRCTFHRASKQTS